MLYHPWREQVQEVDLADCQQIYLQNESSIKVAMEQFTKISDEKIDEYLQMAESIVEDEGEDDVGLSDVENAESDDDVEDFSMYVLPEDNEVDIGEEADALNRQARNTSGDRRIPSSSRQETKTSSTASVTRCARPDILQEEDYQELVSKLNYEQKDALDCAIDSVRHNDNEPLKIYITGGAGTGKSLLISALYQSLIRHYDMNLDRDLRSNSVMLCAPTGKAAFNIRGMTVHSAFHLPLNQTEINSLSSDVSNTMSVELSDLKVVILDEVSMISSRIFLWIDQRLQDIFEADVPFGGRHIIILGDFWQLPPVHDYPIYNLFKNDPMKRLRCLDIWHLFKMHYLKTTMRQRDDASFAVALNYMARGTMTSADIDLFITRTFKELPMGIGTRRSEGIVRLFATNKEVNKCNDTIVTAFSADSFLSTSFDRVVGQGGNSEARKSILELAKSPETPASKTAGLPYQLQLTIDARYMITCNIDTSDGLVNGTTGVLRRVDLGHSSHTNSEGNHVSKPVRVWLEMDSIVSGAKARGQYRQTARKLGIPEN